MMMDKEQMINVLADCRDGGDTTDADVGLFSRLFAIESANISERGQLWISHTLEQHIGERGGLDCSRQCYLDTYSSLLAVAVKHFPIVD
jgi:hypothetical protein